MMPGRGDKPIFLKDGKPVDERSIAEGFRRMADWLAGGGRIVVGTNESIEKGVTLGRDGERHVVIKRRATRQEFLDTAPVRNPGEREKAEEVHAPFYFEVELWDRVIEGSDGSRFGVRIHEQRRKDEC